VKSSHLVSSSRSVLALLCLAVQCTSTAAQQFTPDQDQGSGLAIRRQSEIAEPVQPASNSDPVGNQLSSKSPELRDVRLQDAGRLQLRVIDEAGKPEPDQLVRVFYQNSVIAETRTNASGSAVILGLRPGIHLVATGGRMSAYRLWTQQSAPPSAINAPAVVISEQSIRGQYGYGPGPMMAPGMLATGVTAAAVVAVLVGKDNGDGSVVVTPSSP
jgi:hypothetical protein